MNEITAMLTGLPLLTMLIALPLVAAALLLFVPEGRQVRGVALGATLVELVLSLLALAAFDPGVGGFQLIEQVSWIPSLNIHYKVGVDGLSILFLPLTALLFGGVFLSVWNSIRFMPRLHFGLLLVLQGVTMGIFSSLDTMLFLLFWELTLIPTYFLVGLWGVGPNRRYAAVKYTLLMMGGGVPLLFGFLLAAGLGSAEEATSFVFDLPTLLTASLPADTQLVVFLLLLLGFGVKTPVFPFHTWLPTLAMEGPASVAAIMTGIKLGAYGLIRFTVPLAPDAAQELHWLLAGLGVAGVLYGALAALVQTNLRRLLAYSSISHVGLVVLGIASFSIQGLQGAVFQLLNFTMVAGGIFLVTGFVLGRTGSTDIVHLGGLARTMPLAATFILLLGLAGLGLPATAGFPAEHLIILSALDAHTGAGLAALGGVVIAAAYFLSFYRRAFLGPVTNGVVGGCLDLRPRELWVASLMAALVLVAGLYPAAVLDVTRAAGEAWVAGLGRL